MFNGSDGWLLHTLNLNHLGGEWVGIMPSDEPPSCKVS